MRTAADRVTAAGALESFGPLGSSPCLVVSLADAADLPPERHAPFRRALGSIPCPTVAVGARDETGLGDAFDLHLDADDAVGPVVDAATRSPLAALALVQVLRARAWEEPRPDRGLVLESLAYATLQAGPEHLGWLRAQARRTPSSEPDGAAVELERGGDTLHLRLAHPERRNAFGTRMRDALVEALAIAEADPDIETIALSGLGPCFSSGGDLDEFGTHADPSTAHAIRSTRNPARSLAGLSKRLVAHVHGACIGAGVELPAFARRVTAAPDSTFRLPELAMGLIPGAGGTVSLPRRIGAQRTAWLALTGLPVDAPTARAWGLVDDIHDPSESQQGENAP